MNRKVFKFAVIYSLENVTKMQVIVPGKDGGAGKERARARNRGEEENGGEEEYHQRCS